MTREQVRVATDFFKKNGEGSGCHLMVVATTSYASLKGRPSRLEHVRPSLEMFQLLFDEQPSVFNVLEYVDSDGSDNKYFQIFDELVKIGGPNMHALMLDMVWPDPAVVRDFAEVTDIHLILKVGALAQDDVGYDPDAIAKQLMLYRNALDMVIFDPPSRMDIDTAFIKALLYAVRAKCPNIAVGVDGGVGPKTAGRFETILSEFSNTTLVANRMLRRDNRPSEPVDLEKVLRYLSKAESLFERIGTSFPREKALAAS